MILTALAAAPKQVGQTFHRGTLNRIHVQVIHLRIHVPATVIQIAAVMIAVRRPRIHRPHPLHRRLRLLPHPVLTAAAAAQDAAIVRALWVDAVISNCQVEK